MSHSIRAASTQTTKSPQTPAYPAQAINPSSKSLQPPAPLRNYAFALKTGTVTSVGRMERTVSVLHRHNTWDKRIRKYYPKETRYLVSDPRNSLRDGDVIEFSSGAPKSRHVHHIVERIITPFATPIEDRPAVMSREERQQEREERWATKYLRRESKRLDYEIDQADLVARTGRPNLAEEGLSTAELVRRVTRGAKRVGKVKKLVAERARKE